jgi:RNA polymerase sigma-70 factor (ECF subfamily)
MPNKPVRLAPGPSLRALGEAGAAGDDLELCMAAVAGRRDRAAFGRLVQHFAPRLIGFFAEGGADPAEAEDIALETLAMLWRDAAHYDPRKTTLSAWVFVIARNLRLEGGAAPELPCAGAGERVADLSAAIDGLPREEAAALRLSFADAAPDAAFARALALPREGGKGLLRLAMANLRAALEGGT